MCFLMMTNLLYFCLLAFLLIILTRRIFYAFTLLYGYMTVALALPMLMYKTVNVNLLKILPRYAGELTEIVYSNRLMYYLICLGFVVLGIILTVTDVPKKINRRL